MNGNGFDNGDNEDFIDTDPQMPSSKKRTIKMIEPPPLRVSASDHPQVKIAKEWHATITSAVASLVVGVLAYLQQWPHEVTLTALGLGAGAALMDRLRKKR